MAMKMIWPGEGEGGADDDCSCDKNYSVFFVFSCRIQVGGLSCVSGFSFK